MGGVVGNAPARFSPLRSVVLTSAMERDLKRKGGEESSSREGRGKRTSGRGAGAPGAFDPRAAATTPSS